MTQDYIVTYCLNGQDNWAWLESEEDTKEFIQGFFKRYGDDFQVYNALHVPNAVELAIEKWNNRAEHVNGSDIRIKERLGEIQEKLHEAEHDISTLVNGAHSLYLVKAFSYIFKDFAKINNEIQECMDLIDVKQGREGKYMKNETKTGTAKQFKQLEELAAPLVTFLNENYHPHASIIIDNDRVRVVEDALSMPIGQTRL